MGPRIPAAATTFVGRAAELAAVTAAVRAHRLVTVVGPGGAGKTRVAYEAVAGLGDRLLGLVELAGVPAGEDPSGAVLAGCGVREDPALAAAERLVDRLADDEGLVVLDNAEHVRAPVAELVADLLRGCPGVRVLATSRAALAVAGEVVVGIDGLRLPEATELVLERVRRVQAAPDDEASRRAAGQVARAADGLPLAIELAAARARSRSLAELARTMGDQLEHDAADPVGRPARHRSLRASIAWSVGLLDPAARTALAALALFPGRFTRASALASAGGGGVGVDALVDHSLVALDPVDGRLLLLDTVREYVRTELTPDPAAWPRLIAHVVALAADAADGLARADPDVLADLDRETAAVRAVLAHAVDDGTPATVDAAAGIVADLAFWWSLRGRCAAGRTWARRLAAAFGTAGRTVPPRLGWAHAFLAVYSGDIEGGVELAAVVAAAADDSVPDGSDPDGSVSDGSVPDDSVPDDSVPYGSGPDGSVSDGSGPGGVVPADPAGVDPTGDAVARARALVLVGMAEAFADPAGAEATLRRASELAAGVGDRWGRVEAVQVIAYTHLHRSVPRQALADADALATDLAALGHDQLRAWDGAIRADAAAQLGEFGAAVEAGRDGLERAVRVGEPVSAIGALMPLVVALCALGREEEAGRHIEAHTGFAADHPGLAVPLSLELTRTHHGLGRGVAPDPGALAALAATASEAGIPVLAARAAALLAVTELMRGSPAGVVAAAAEARRHAATVGHREYALVADLVEALACRRPGPDGPDGPAVADPGSVRAALDEAATLGLRPVVADALDVLAGLARDDGHPTTTLRLHAASARLRAQMGAGVSSALRTIRDADAHAATSALTPHQAAEATAQGARLDAERAVAWALRSHHPRRRPATGWDSLTPTEREVVDLVSRGLGNQAVADQLLVGVGTVRTHLRSVFAKLGVATRTELTARAATRRRDP